MITITSPLITLCNNMIEKSASIISPICILYIAYLSSFIKNCLYCIVLALFFDWIFVIFNFYHANYNFLVSSILLYILLMSYLNQTI